MRKSGALWHLCMRKPDALWHLCMRKPDAFMTKCMCKPDGFITECMCKQMLMTECIQMWCFWALLLDISELILTLKIALGFDQFQIY